MTKKKILFVFTSRSSFVNKDIGIFSEQYHVSCFEFNVRNKIFTPLVFIKQFFFLLFNIWRFDIIICQFAAYHSFLPLLFAKVCGKPSLLILGGTDCASFPSINYGNYNKKLLGFFTSCSVKLASHLAPKHESLIYFKYDYDNRDYDEQGVKCFVKNFKTPYTVIHNGYDAEKFTPQPSYTQTGSQVHRTYALRGGGRKKNSFITVAGYNNPNIIPLKGIDLITEVAPHFPECTFTIVGTLNVQRSTFNVQCLPEQSNDSLIKLFSEHEFYLQLSMSEGFPNAICEAMLCECIPIGSDVNAIPDIIGDTGFILKKRNSEMLKELLTDALKADKNYLRKAARERIANNFSVETRKQNLLKLIEKLVINKPSRFSFLKKSFPHPCFF